MEILLYCFPVLSLFILQECLPFVAADVHEPAGDHKTSHPTPLFKTEVGGEEGKEWKERGEEKGRTPREEREKGLVSSRGQSSKKTASLCPAAPFALRCKQPFVALFSLQGCL